MKPSREAIEEMKRRGYDPSTLTYEQMRLAHYETGLALIPVIEEAFAGVTLGTGVGLMQAQGLDDYESAEQCALYRRDDEKEDWRKIPSEKLRACNSSPSFFDAEGLRFHIPAYMIAELKNEYDFGLAGSSATRLSDERLRIFTPEQRETVRLFLLHALTKPGNSFSRPRIQEALNAPPEE